MVYGQLLTSVVVLLLASFASASSLVSRKERFDISMQRFSDSECEHPLDKARGELLRSGDADGCKVWPGKEWFRSYTYAHYMHRPEEDPKKHGYCHILHYESPDCSGQDILKSMNVNDKKLFRECPLRSNEEKSFRSIRLYCDGA